MCLSFDADVFSKPYTALWEINAEQRIVMKASHRALMPQNLVDKLPLGFQMHVELYDEYTLMKSRLNLSRELTTDSSMSSEVKRCGNRSGGVSCSSKI